MVEGSSGILEVCWEYDRDCNDDPLGKPNYEPSKRRVTWLNGAMATTFSAEEPERLRGPQHELLWCDELAAWQYAQDCWDMAMFGLRIGTHPRVMVTTTPKPIPVIRELMRSDNCKITRATTYANLPNLAPSFVNALMQRYEGTRIGRQELMGEVLDEAEGALWNRDMVAAALNGKRSEPRALPPSGQLLRQRMRSSIGSERDLRALMTPPHRATPRHCPRAD
jgi:phage terminase large subunit-like protein